MTIKGSARLRAGFEQIARDDVFDLQREFAHLDLGELKDLVDQIEKIFAALVDPQKLFALTLGRRRLGAIQQQFGKADDGMQRRAQLVAHAGQEVRLGLAGGIGGQIGLGQFHLLLFQLLVGLEQGLVDGAFMPAFDEQAEGQGGHDGRQENHHRIQGHHGIAESRRRGDHHFPLAPTHGDRGGGMQLFQQSPLSDLGRFREQLALVVGDAHVIDMHLDRRIFGIGAILAAALLGLFAQGLTGQLDQIANAEHPHGEAQQPGAALLHAVTGADRVNGIEQQNPVLIAGSLNQLDAMGADQLARVAGRNQRLQAHGFGAKVIAEGRLVAGLGNLVEHREIFVAFSVGNHHPFRAALSQAETGMFVPLLHHLLQGNAALTRDVGDAGQSLNVRMTLPGAGGQASELGARGGDRRMNREMPAQHHHGVDGGGDIGLHRSQTRNGQFIEPRFVRRLVRPLDGEEQADRNGEAQEQHQQVIMLGGKQLPHGGSPISVGIRQGFQERAQLSQTGRLGQITRHPRRLRHIDGFLGRVGTDGKNGEIPMKARHGP